MLSSKVHIEECSVAYLSSLEHDSTVYFQKQNNFSEIDIFPVKKDSMATLWCVGGIYLGPGCWEKNPTNELKLAN